MDPTTTTTLTVSTQNVNGYSRNKDFLFTLCEENKNSIRAIQEHWLKPPYKNHSGVNQMRNLHPEFDRFGTSAMKKSVDSQILKGRPYGGTGFLFNKRFSRCLKPQHNYTHERVSVMRFETEPFDLMLINVCFPYYNTRDLATHMALYRDTIGFVESVMSQNTECKYIILADFNCNIHDTQHPYTSMVRDLMQKYRLISAFDCVSNFDFSNSFTRFDVKT